MYIYVIVCSVTYGEYMVDDRSVVYAGTDARQAYEVGMEHRKDEDVTCVDCEVWKDGEYKFDVEVK